MLICIGDGIRDSLLVADLRYIILAHSYFIFPFVPLFPNLPYKP